MLNQITVVDGGAQPKNWDRFVANSSASTFCHQAGWRSVIESVLGHECLFLSAIDAAGEWRAVLPLARIRSPLGHYLISLPFLNDGGPLGEPTAQKLLVEHAVAEARRTGAELVELRSRENVPGPVTPSRRRIAVHLGLPNSVEQLWKQTLRAKVRSQIRRPMKEGMVFHTGPTAAHDFYEVFSRNMRDLGTPVLPQLFFQRINEMFGDQVLFAAVNTKTGEAAAVACCFHWKNELEVMWASSLRKLNHLSPNMLLYAGLMEEAIRRGVRDFNFGRSVKGESTHRFKQQWGGRDVDLPWPTWSTGKGRGIPSRDGRIVRIAIGAWRHLPLAVANRLGPPLSRFLP